MKTLMILLRFDNGESPNDPHNCKKVDYYFLPLILAYISTFLKSERKEVTILNLNNRKGLVRDILRFELHAVDYEVVSLGGLSIFYLHLRNIIQHVRDFSKRTRAVVGGKLRC